MSYAKHAFCIDMTIEQARQFRKRLITQIYPELQAYLADNQHATIAANLRTTEVLARRALPKWDQVK